MPTETNVASVFLAGVQLILQERIPEVLYEPNMHFNLTHTMTTLCRPSKVVFCVLVCVVAVVCLRVDRCTPVPKEHCNTNPRDLYYVLCYE